MSRNRTDANRFYLREGHLMSHRWSSRIALIGALLLGATSAAAGATDAQKCEAGKLKEAGKYGFCRLKAEAKAVKTGSAPDYGNCDVKYGSKWPSIEADAGGTCPSNGDEGAMQAFIAQHTDDVTAALAGGPLPDCPGDMASCSASLDTCQADLAAAMNCQNGVVDDGEDCDQDELGGANCVSEGFAGGTLTCGADCAIDTSGCWSARFVDNGNGTVSDRQTGLMWEKKDDFSGIHDKDNTYNWCIDAEPDSFCDNGGAPDGDVFTVFLATLNDAHTDDGFTNTRCFAGHCDWRLPTIGELRRLLAEPYHPCNSPCLDPIFGSLPTIYEWARNTSLSDDYAWVIYADTGYTLTMLKGTPRAARAVRGGS